MKPLIHQLLMKHWGFAKFRPMQEDIILSVLDRNDTLALLPTGGGKSICFQIPAIALGGVCLVITPLIALMKDQVSNLKSRNIPARALFSGMSYREEEIAINDAINGRINFLYISPERIQTQRFRNILHEIPVKLIAVDEAHCISQWGYDFRPPYLKIATLRDFFPNTPFLALTATATPEVVIDIQEKLEFSKKNVFSKSFERTNLTYFVVNEEDKLNRLLRILKKNPGSGIIYVRNRRKTAETAHFLYTKGINASFYHAGLERSVRDQRQELWTKGKIEIMVSTNAFGMGIDKSNVRIVVHLDIPDCIEAYFQEAGRAGRDEKNANAILLWEQADILNAKTNFLNSFPEPSFIKNVYIALGNYLNIAIGCGQNESYDFDLITFSKQYNFKPLIAYKSLAILEREGLILQGSQQKATSKLLFKMKRNDLYLFQLEHTKLDILIRLLLRLYGGLFSDFVSINERDIARHAKISEKALQQLLTKLHKMSVVEYLPRSGKAQIIFVTERLSEKDIPITAENYYNRKKTAQKRLNAIVHYITSSTRCRSELLLEYFGEKAGQRCGKCDVCLTRNDIQLSKLEFDQIIEKLKDLLRERALPLTEILEQFEKIPAEDCLRALQWLLNKEKVKQNFQLEYYWV